MINYLQSQVLGRGIEPLSTLRKSVVLTVRRTEHGKGDTSLILGSFVERWWDSSYYQVAVMMGLEPTTS